MKKEAEMSNIFVCVLQQNGDGGYTPKSQYEPVAVPIWHGGCSPYRYWFKKRSLHAFQRWIEARTVLGTWRCLTGCQKDFNGRGKLLSACLVACPVCGEPAPVPDRIAFGKVVYGGSHGPAVYCEVRIGRRVGCVSIKLQAGNKSWLPENPQLRLTLGLVARLMATEAAFGATRWEISERTAAILNNLLVLVDGGFWRREHAASPVCPEPEIVLERRIANWPPDDQ
jgi:hypothetical protein